MAECNRHFQEALRRGADQRFQSMLERQFKSTNPIHYQPYSPNTPLIQPIAGGSLSANDTRPWIVLASTGTSGFGTFLIAACITTDFCSMAASGGSVGVCVCVVCTAYHVNEYYRTKPFVLKSQNQQEPQETNSWSWLSFENCSA